MMILSATDLQIRSRPVTERLNNSLRAVDLLEIQEIPIKIKGFESQPAAGRLGSDEISFKFPLKSLQIRLEAGLGLWKTFKKPAAIVRDLQNPQNLTAGQKVVPKRRKIEVRKKV